MTGNGLTDALAQLSTRICFEIPPLTCRGEGGVFPQMKIIRVYWNVCLKINKLYASVLHYNTGVNYTVWWRGGGGRLQCRHEPFKMTSGASSYKDWSPSPAKPSPRFSLSLQASTHGSLVWSSIKMFVFYIHQTYFFQIISEW